VISDFEGGKNLLRNGANYTL